MDGEEDEEEEEDDDEEDDEEVVVKAMPKVRSKAAVLKGALRRGVAKGSSKKARLRRQRTTGRR